MTGTRPAADGQPAGGSTVGKRVTLLALLLMLLPVGLAVGLFPLLSGGPFDSVDAIDPAAVKSLDVRLFNRAELDGGFDVGPFRARPEDVPALLAPLTGLAPLAGPPADARGPWLGEYRVRTTTGRRGTVRFYWSRRPDVGQGAPPAAVAGPAILTTRPELVPGAFVLRVVAGDKWYEGGNPLAVVAAAEAAADAVGAPPAIR